MVKRGDLVMWDGGSAGNILSGVVLSIEAVPSTLDAEDTLEMVEYLTVRWQTGKITIMPAKYRGLEVISECR